MDDAWRRMMHSISSPTAGGDEHCLLGLHVPDCRFYCRDSHPPPKNKHVNEGINHTPEGANSSDPPCRLDTTSGQQRARHRWQRRRLGHRDHLPLFRRGSAPVSMTTRRLLRSAGLDIHSVSGGGCRAAQHTAPPLSRSQTAPPLSRSGAGSTSLL